MRRPNIFRFVRLSLLGSVTFLAGALFLTAPPADAARASARAHGHHGTGIRRHGAGRTARAHAGRYHYAVNRNSRRGRLLSARARSRREGLEPRHPAPRAEIAKAPLKHFLLLPPLRGSRESLLRQNERADQEGLMRVADDRALAAMANSKELAPIPESAALHVDPRLELNRRYCRPWAARFLADLANMYYARFHTPLQVNSAVRTVAYQRHLLLINGNAAPAEGDTRSPHLTGEAIDIGKKDLSPTEIGWLRAYLSAFESAGKLDVEEEFEQACFHISVYKSYAPAPLLEPRIQTAAQAPRSRRRRHRTAAALLAARLR